MMQQLSPPKPHPLFPQPLPHPQQESRIISQMMELLFPRPKPHPLPQPLLHPLLHPLCASSHPHPLFVAAKSLMFCSSMFVEYTLYYVKGLVWVTDS